MRADPEVNRRKYHWEINRLSDQKATLEKRGIFVLGSSSFPRVDLLYVPRNPLRVVLPDQKISFPQLPPNHNPAFDFPSLSARAFKARFDLTDYDVVPPSIEFLDPWTDAPLIYDTMFRALEFEKQRGVHVVLLPAHPLTNRPFLCLRGVREYHNHPQHSGDDWFLYRDKVSLFALIISLWRVSLDITRPQIALQLANNQIQIQMQWAAEEKV